nr:MAG TPA: Putative capsid protein [Bacteriophage sp.]
MNTYQNIGDLMGYFGVTSSPVFATLYNTMFAKGETKGLDMRGAAWGRLQDVFTYEMWEKYNNVEAMATFTDLYSDPRALGGSVKYNKLTGSIPRHKAIMTIGEVDITEKKHQLYALRSALAGQASVETMVQQDLEDYFYDKVSAIPNAHKNTVNFMLGQLKSRLDFTLDDRTNPNGIKGLTFPSHVPDANRKAVKFWTVAADGKIAYNMDVDPVEWIQKLVYDIKNDQYHGYDRVTCEMNAKSFKLLLRHPSWAKRIAYALNSAFYLTASNDKNSTAYGTNWLLTASPEAQVNIFKQICDIDEVFLSTAVTATEVAVKQTGVAPKLRRNKMDCFDEGRMLLRPSGNVITIIPVAPNRADTSVITASMFGGRGIIEYWYEPRQKVATWRSELTCLPVFTVPSQVYNVAFTEKAATYSVVANPTGNPSTNGYYEKSGNDYVLSTDTTVDNSKTYYTKDA